ncbi:MAG: hypothetical protein SGBAC_003794 [Bacillariaceae sp.]
MMTRVHISLVHLALVAVVRGTNNGNQYYNVNDYYTDDRAQQNGGNGEEYADDWASSGQNYDDDMFHWSDNIGFDGVSVMPLSCINYNNGYMIKYTFFDAANRNQCHFNEIGTFIVSIAHYMRANFNHEALLYGTKYTLPSDAGYLNCVQLSETENTDTPLYAKIGCQDRETYTSTKLSLKVYTDAQCSELYDDGKTQRYHANKGYVVNGKLISSKVSFRPPFYKCEACSPSQISDTFNKLKVSWYDDDYINENGEKRDYDEDGDGNQEEQGDDQGNNNNANQDDYFNDDFHDDYFQANDDFNNQYYYAKDNGNRQLAATDGTVRSELQPSKPVAAEGQLEAFTNEFWKDIEHQKRALYDNNYDIGEWNMCQRVYKYGVWCDEDCRSLDQFRRDLWSGSDIILLSIMCTFLAGMMILIVAKRIKAAKKSRKYKQQGSMPGLPPLAMLALFGCIMLIIGILAHIKFVNETLLFAVVACVLVFIYMLKLTLFHTRDRPILLAAPDWDTDSRLDERIY